MTSSRCIDALAGTFHFFVSILEWGGEIQGGEIVHNQYILTQELISGIKIALNLQPGDSRVEAFNSANPNVIDVEEIIPVPGNPKLAPLRLATPISSG